MAAILLDGNKIAAEIRAEIASEVKAMTAAGVRPGLAVVLVGHNPASEIYVRGKVKSSQEVGIYSEQHTPPETVSTGQLLSLIADLNRRDPSSRLTPSTKLIFRILVPLAALRVEGPFNNAYGSSSCAR